MPTFDRDELNGLLAPHAPPCVSLFLPTHRHPPQVDQDSIRLRNLLRDTRTQLEKAASPEQVRRLLEPLAGLAKPSVRGPIGDGMAVFRSADLFRHYVVPAPLPERVVVADTFYLRPVLPFLDVNQRYYLLTLSQKQVRLFAGTPLSPLRAVEVPDLPVSLEDALGAEHGEAFLTVRTAGRGSADTLYHGHGDAEGAREEDLRRYFRMVDAAVWKRLRRERAPLFLAGVAHHLPLYRELSRYPSIAEQGLEGNVDDIGAEELCERALPLLEDLCRAHQDQILKEFARSRDQGLAELELKAIGRHAVAGRVSRLLLGRGREKRGVFDHRTGQLRSLAASDDVLDDLAQAVLVRAGEVMTLPAEQIPGAAAAAAILRW